MNAAGDTTHLPEPPFEENGWKFDERVTDQFDQMLGRSIPHYAAMRSLSFQIGRAFARDGTDIYDLGCSRGEAVAPYIEALGARASYSLVEASLPMAEAARARYSELVQAGIVGVYHEDLRSFYPASMTGGVSLVLSVLTLMFTPVEYRQLILRRIFDSLAPGGALVVVEKVIAEGVQTDSLLRAIHHAMKLANGYRLEEISRKAFALEGVLVPLTAQFNEKLLRDAGFPRVECFWRALNFAGWVAVKG